MSATASPGRTWIISGKRRVPNLASKAAAALFRGGDRGVRLPSLARADPSAQPAPNLREDGAGGQPVAELGSGRRLDRASDPVQIE